MTTSLKPLSKTEQRKLYGAAWDDVPPVVAEKIRSLFDATDCMDLYDSPCQFLDAATQVLKEQAKQIGACKKLISSMREIVGDPEPSE